MKSQFKLMIDVVLMISLLRIGDRERVEQHYNGTEQLNRCRAFVRRMRDERGRS